MQKEGDMKINKREELKASLKELREWADRSQSVFFPSVDSIFGDYHGVMSHLRRSTGYLADHLMPYIIRVVIGPHARLALNDTLTRVYPPLGISREDLMSNLLTDIEAWVDTNLDFMDMDFESAMSDMSFTGYDDDNDIFDDNSILSLLEVIHTIKRMVDDYFPEGRDPDERWFVSFRELSQEEREWLDSVNERINHGEKRFLTQPEIDRLGSLIAYDSPGTLADFLGKAWSDAP